MSTESRKYMSLIVVRQQMHLCHQPSLMAGNGTGLGTNAFSSAFTISSYICVNIIVPSYNFTTSIPWCSPFCKSWKSPFLKQVQHGGNNVLLPSTMNTFYSDTSKIMSIQRFLLLLRDNLCITVHTGATLLVKHSLGQPLFLPAIDASMSPGPTNLMLMGKKVNLPAKSICSSATWDLLQKLLSQITVPDKPCPLTPLLRKAASQPQGNS